MPSDSSPAATARSKPSQQGVTALVVGGSLSGLLVALALSRVGIRSTLLERASAHRPSGAALAADATHLELVIGPAKARRVLDRLGASPTGATGSVPAAWQDLYTGLRDLALGDRLVTVHHDTPVGAVGQDSSGVWASTTAGATVCADLLVGADGYRSVVRRSLFPNQSEAAYAGYALWRGVVDENEVVARPWPGTDMLDAGSDLMFGYPLPGEDGSRRPGERRLGFAWYDVSRNDLLNRTGAVQNGAVRHSLTADHIPQAVYQDLLVTARHTWPTPWPGVVEAAVTTGAVILTPIAEHVPDEMARGRTALVGDAAHVATPMTGAGFGAALADAEELASQLAGARGTRVDRHDSVAAALAGYQAARLHEARRIVVSGQQFSRSFARNAA